MCILLGRKVMTNLEGILKSRDITLPTQVRLVKAMVSPVVMCGCEIWTIKKAECQKTDAFGTVVLEKTLESPLECKEVQPVHPKGDQSWVFIGGLMLKLKLQYFGHLMWRADSLENTLMLGKIEGRRRKGQQKKTTTDGWHHRLNGRVWVKSGSWWWTGRPGVLWSMGLQRVRHDWVTELNWTEWSDTWFTLLYSRN